jgi:hypothetical protein
VDYRRTAAAREFIDAAVRARHEVFVLKRRLLFVRQILERAADADLNDALTRLVFDPLGIEGAFVADTPEELDAIVWGNPQQHDPRLVYHGCIVGSLSWAAPAAPRPTRSGDEDRDAHAPQLRRRRECA